MKITKLSPISIEESELPDGWTNTTMGEVANVVGGGTPNTRESDNFANDGHPWITPADLSGFSEMYISRGRRGLTEKGLRSCSATMVPKGTVLMSSRAPIGYVAIAGNSISTSQGFKSFVCSEGIVPEFVYFWLKSTKLELENMGSGSTFLEISGGRAKEIPLRLAPVPEQRRIATKVEKLLTRIDAAHERLIRVPGILRSFRGTVLTAACSGRLTDDWRVNHSVSEPASALLESLLLERQERWTASNGKRKYRPPESVLDEDLPSIPESWCWTNFDHCSWEITVGYVGPMKDRYVAKGVPFLRSQNVRPLRFDAHGLVHIPKSFHAQLSKSKLSGGEILTVRTGANTGDCCIFPRDSGIANCADLVITRPLSGLCAEYAALYINSPDGQARLTLRETGIAQPHFNIGAMRVKAFPLPPLAEQREIARRVEALFILAAAIEKRVATATTRAEKLVQTVLTKGFLGELVPQDPNDEPATALLERIRAARTAETPRRRQRKDSETILRTSKDETPMLKRIEIQPKHLTNILEKRGPLTAEDLWSASQLDIDDFYDQLKDEEARGFLKEIRNKSATSPRLLKAVA
jgi:type I restriction enzyme, S subunit